jgi:hypothetical protein
MLKMEDIVGNSENKNIDIIPTDDEIITDSNTDDEEYESLEERYDLEPFVALFQSRVFNKITAIQSMFNKMFKTKYTKNDIEPITSEFFSKNNKNDYFIIPDIKLYITQKLIKAIVSKIIFNPVFEFSEDGYEIIDINVLYSIQSDILTYENGSYIKITDQNLINFNIQHSKDVIVNV